MQNNKATKKRNYKNHIKLKKGYKEKMEQYGKYRHMQIIRKTAQSQKNLWKQTEKQSEKELTSNYNW